MLRFDVALQSPVNDCAIERLIVKTARLAPFSRLRAAYAYASDGGVYVMTTALRRSLTGWPALSKRWLIALDFGITSPGALESLLALENSAVRTIDSSYLLANRLAPRTCFHPKTLLLDSGTAATPTAIVNGSANLTVNGLQAGYEHATATAWIGNQSQTTEAQLSAVRQEADRFEQIWTSADVVDEALIDEYRSVRKRVTKKPKWQEEDNSREVKEKERETATRSFEKAAALARADCFWVDVQNVYRNRGAGQEGNQVDLAKGSRVFFGGTAATVPINTLLADIQIRYGSNPPVGRHLRFGNNQMDKLDLPVPGSGGPPSYANSTLLFEREASGVFRVRVGSAASRVGWKRKSTDQGTAYAMASGGSGAPREYGVFRN